MREALARIETKGLGRQALLMALRAVWTLTRLPLLALLNILEPVARVALAGFALLMTLTALFWVGVRGLSAFPFWELLSIGLGALFLLALYYALIRLLSF